MATKGYFNGLTMTVFELDGKQVVLLWSGAGGLIRPYDQVLEEADSILEATEEKNTYQWRTWLDVWPDDFVEDNP